MNREDCENCGGVGACHMCDNKLIAEFMGNLRIYKVLLDPNAELKRWRVDNYNNVFLQRAKEMLEQARKEGYINAEIEMDISILKFHSSWDWLMPVVEKCYQLDEYYIYKTETTRQFYDSGIELKTEITSVYNDVIDFLNWYNKNKIKTEDKNE